MAEIPILRIPERYRPGFQQLALGEEEEINKLINILKDLPPTLNLGSIASVAAEQIGMDSDETRSLLGAITSLYSLRDSAELSTQSIVDHIGQALKDDENLQDLSDDEISRFQNRLSKFLELRGSLETSSKARELLLEYKNLFLGSRVLTDIRPVFKDAVEEGLAGALVVHELRVNYRTASGTDEFFVALDSDDLEQLLEQVERALEKEQVLASFLKENRVPYLEAGSEIED